MHTVFNGMTCEMYTRGSYTVHMEYFLEYFPEKWSHFPSTLCKVGKVYRLRFYNTYFHTCIYDSQVLNRIFTLL